MKKAARRTSPKQGAREAARGGIQSVDAALQLLSVIGASDGPASLSDLARAARMSPTKAHRYLASFVHARFVTQGERSGRYDVGPEAVKLGLAAIARNDFVNRAADKMAELASSLRITVLLAVWGPHGSTVVRWERSPSLTNTSLGLGSTLPLLTSAGGRIFLSYLPRHMTAALVESELEQARQANLVIPDLRLTRHEVDALAARIRADGIASIDGGFITGLRAAAVPITNWQGEIETAVVAVGSEDGILLANSPIQRRLRSFAESISVGEWQQATSDA
jgi:DNA-binding IclR family transcriptional regulator